MHRCVTWAAALALLAPLPAPAAEPAPAPTHDASMQVDQQVLDVILKARQRGSTLLNDTEVSRIRELLLADGKLDENERDVIDELTAGSVGAINTRLIGGDGKITIIGTVSGPREAYLREAMNVHYAALYGEELTVAGWEELVGESRISDGALGRMRDFLGARALVAAKESTAANAWKPARTLLTEWSTKNREIDPALQDRGRWLIHDGFEIADEATNNALPDFIYDWVNKPPAE